LRILVVNAGSSRVKLSLLGDGDQTIGELELQASGSQVDGAELKRALAAGLGDADVVAHRIVHGGERFTEARHSERCRPEPTRRSPPKLTTRYL
jgi:acetate kinase